jgi:GntR family transcriptional regulator/MocR family aminotransferase
MRTLYEERQHTLVERAKRQLADFLTVDTADAGMHLVGTLAYGINDIHASERAAAHGIVVTPISKYYLEQPTPLTPSCLAMPPSIHRRSSRA